jgi:uncharacterized protein YjlB
MLDLSDGASLAIARTHALLKAAGQCHQRLESSQYTNSCGQTPTALTFEE